MNWFMTSFGYLSGTAVVFRVLTKLPQAVSVGRGEDISERQGRRVTACIVWAGVLKGEALKETIQSAAGSSRW